MQGYSTLGSQWLMKGYDSNPVLTHSAVIEAAHEVQRSPAQVVLRWALQHGQVGLLQHHTPQYSHSMTISFLFRPQQFVRPVST
jgi:diketogulonate reductase-like aldo/keto reductase